MTSHGAHPRPAAGTSRRRLVIVSGLAVGGLAIVLRGMGLGRDLWLDEYASVDACCRTHGQAWLRGVVAQMLPYHLGLSLWRLIDDSVWFLRLPSMVLALATVGATMQGLWARSGSAAVLAGVLLACSPIMLRYGLEIRGYGLVVACAAVAFAIVSRPDALERRSLRVALSVTLSVALATHPTAVMLVPALILVCAATRPARAGDLGAWTGVLVPPALVATLATGASVWLQRGAHAQWWMPEPTLPVIVGVLRVVAGTDRIAWPLAGATGAALMAAAAVAVAAPLRRSTDGGPGDRRLGVALVAAAALYLAGLVAGSLVFPVFWPRTAFIALVPAASGIALLLATYRRALVRVAGAVAVVVVCSAWIADWVQGGAWTAVEPWREAASRIERTWRPGDTVVFYPDYVAGPILYYAPRIDPSSVVSLRLLEDAAGIERKVRAVHAAGERVSSTTFVMIRADFSVRAHGDTVERLLSALSATRHDHDIHLVVLTASDVAVEPRLADTAEGLVTLAAERFGPPVQTVESASRLLERVFRRSSPR